MINNRSGSIPPKQASNTQIEFNSDLNQVKSRLISRVSTKKGYAIVHDSSSSADSLLDDSAGDQSPVGSNEYQKVIGIYQHKEKPNSPMKPTFGSSNNVQNIKEIERIERNVIAPTDSKAILVASTEQPQSKKSNGK